MFGDVTFNLASKKTNNKTVLKLENGGHLSPVLGLK